MGVYENNPIRGLNEKNSASQEPLDSKTSHGPQPHPPAMLWKRSLCRRWTENHTPAERHRKDTGGSAELRSSTLSEDDGSARRLGRVRFSLRVQRAWLVQKAAVACCFGIDERVGS